MPNLLRINCAWRNFKHSLPSPCPLCRLPARGGLLCCACREDCLSSRQLGQFCPNCALKISYTEVVCESCQVNPPSFSYAWAAVDYRFPVPLLMHQYKILCQVQLASVFADLIWQSMQGHCVNWPAINCWVAVPSSARALKKRGFNPAGEIARHLSALSGLPSLRSALKVNEDAASMVQKKASRDLRWLQAQHRYQAGQALKGQWVGLVDDVMTTGSTLNACARTLKTNGASGVVAVTLARTPRTLAQF